MDASDFPHLENVITGGLMRRVTPPDVAERLIEAGYIRRAVGGYMPTEHGHKFFRENHAKNDPGSA